MCSGTSSAGSRLPDLAGLGERAQADGAGTPRARATCVAELDADATQARAVKVVGSLGRQEQPVVMILEDIHWAARTA
jgi:hypothetical protein